MNTNELAAAIRNSPTLMARTKRSIAETIAVLAKASAYSDDLRDHTLIAEYNEHLSFLRAAVRMAGAA